MCSYIGICLSIDHLLTSVHLGCMCAHICGFHLCTWTFNSIYTAFFWGKKFDAHQHFPATHEDDATCTQGQEMHSEARRETLDTNEWRLIGLVVAPRRTVARSSVHACTLLAQTDRSMTWCASQPASQPVHDETSDATACTLLHRNVLKDTMEQGRHRTSNHRSVDLI